MSLPQMVFRKGVTGSLRGVATGTWLPNWHLPCEARGEIPRVIHSVSARLWWDPGLSGETLSDLDTERSGVEQGVLLHQQVQAVPHLGPACDSLSGLLCVMFTVYDMFVWNVSHSMYLLGILVSIVCTVMTVYGVSIIFICVYYVQCAASHFSFYLREPQSSSFWLY